MKPASVAVRMKLNDKDGLQSEHLQPVFFEYVFLIVILRLQIRKERQRI